MGELYSGDLFWWIREQNRHGKTCAMGNNDPNSDGALVHAKKNSPTYPTARPPTHPNVPELSEPAPSLFPVATLRIVRNVALHIADLLASPVFCVHILPTFLLAAMDESRTSFCVLRWKGGRGPNSTFVCHAFETFSLLPPFPDHASSFFHVLHSLFSPIPGAGPSRTIQFRSCHWGKHLCITSLPLPSPRISSPLFHVYMMKFSQPHTHISRAFTRWSQPPGIENLGSAGNASAYVAFLSFTCSCRCRCSCCCRCVSPLSILSDCLGGWGLGWVVLCGCVQRMSGTRVYSRVH
jgi:hypothetical protein